MCQKIKFFKLFYFVLQTFFMDVLHEGDGWGRGGRGNASFPAGD